MKLKQLGELIVLHWQLLKWLKGLSLGTKIILISTLGHLWVLFSLFVLYKGSSPYNVVVTSTMINTDVPVVFMPLHKSLNKSSGGQKQRGVDQKNGKSMTQSSAQDLTTAKTVKEKAATILVEPIRSNPSTSSGRAEKKKKVTKDKKQSQKEVKADQKKKKLADAKALADKKKSDREVFDKEQKKEKESISARPELVEGFERDKKLVEQKSLQPQPLSLNADAAPDGDNVLYVGQQEMEALQMQDYIQQEMAQHWSPPSGMRKDLMCIVKVIVAFDGTLARIDLEQPSGVLLFDGAAKKAASQLQPPRWAYGKELSITFKP